MPNAYGGDQLHPAYTGEISKDPLIVYSKSTEWEYRIKMKHGIAVEVYGETVEGRTFTITPGTDWWNRLPRIVKNRIKKLEGKMENKKSKMKK